MDQIPCLDGYLLNAHSPLADGHHTLNQYLVRVEEAGWQTALKEINAIRNKPRKLLTWKALIERMRWLRDNNPTNVHVSPLRGLAERIEKWTLEPTEADLLAILEASAGVADFLAPYTPLPHLMSYTESNGLSRQMSAGICHFRERVYNLSYAVNQVSLQLFRSRLDMLGWRDEWNDVDLKRCWSEQIRADFRSMVGTQRENWRRILYSIHGDEGTRPVSRWLSDSQRLIQAIGPQVFGDSLMRWFKPLERGCTQRLSREGSFILRSFIWLAESTKVPGLLTKIGEIPEVDFKPRSNGQKVIRAAAEATGQADPTVKPPVSPPSFQSLVARAVAAALSPANSLVPPELAERIQFSGELVFVRGEMDSYRVDISTGDIFRVSDGKQVLIPAGVPEFAANGLPAAGGIMRLLREILILAEDAKHATEFTAKSEE